MTHAEAFLDPAIEMRPDVPLGWDEEPIGGVERLPQRTRGAAIRIAPDAAANIGSAAPVAKLRTLGNGLPHEYRDIGRSVMFPVAPIEVPALSVEAELLLDGLGFR